MANVEQILDYNLLLVRKIMHLTHMRNIKPKVKPSEEGFWIRQAATSSRHSWFVSISKTILAFL